MTIKRGEDWGTLQRPDASIVTVRSDAELRDLVIAHRASGEPMPTVGLLGGDLMRTVGGSGDADRLRGDEPIPHLPIDLVGVVADENRSSVFVAHLVARRSWWRGPVTAAMNAQFLGSWDVSPRCHPNDGRVDVVRVAAELGVRQRLQARRRLPLGVHVPHPSIAVSRYPRDSFTFDRPTPIWLDGQRWSSATRLELMVEPDAFVVCV